MKFLYIDNRDYGHNRDLHIDFIKSIEQYPGCQVYGFGRHLDKFLTNTQLPGRNPNKELKFLVNKFKPNYILTLNSNGSSYELKLDNLHLYEWCQEFLSTTSVFKIHITTDYCRSGFRKEQANWFKNYNYQLALFRHKIALEFPIEVPAFWLPFSVDKNLYNKYSIKNIKEKEKKVGFIGAAHNSSKSLYSNRIAAIEYLLEKKHLNITKVTNPKKFERKLLFGPEYIKFLTKNLFNLTCGGTCNFMTAKYFQIPAAYSMLICTDTVGLDIFPSDTYLTYNQNNLSDLYEKIIYHENNLKETKFKIATLNQYVLDNHNHQERIKELIKLIKDHQ